MNVLVNRWHADRFEQPHVRCSCCGKQATVVQLPLYDRELPVVDLANICAACLSDALSAISAAVLLHGSFTVIDL